MNINISKVQHVDEYIRKLKSVCPNGYNKGQEIWRKYYDIPGMEVSDRGSVRRKYGDNIDNPIQQRPPKYMKWQYDKKGNPVIRTQDYGELRIADLVESCFHGKVLHGHRVIHIDGNKKNCRKDNLKKISIKEYNQRFHANDDWKEFSYEKDDIQVNVKTREIRQHGKVLTVINQLYDRDTASFFPISDSVELEVSTRYGHSRTRYSVSELVNAVV